MTFQGQDPSPDHSPGWELKVPLGLGVRFEPQDEGAHSLDIYVDEKFAQAVPFVVREGAPSGST